MFKYGLYVFKDSQYGMEEKYYNIIISLDREIHTYFLYCVLTGK